MALQTDLGAAHAKALEQAGSVIAGIRPDQLAEATPCKQWNVRQLTNHLVGANWMMSMVGRGETVDPEGRTADLLGDDAVGAYRTSSKAAAEAFASAGALERSWVLPFAEVPGAVARNIHIMETVTHTWDLAKATGQTANLDPELGEVAYGVATGLVQPQFRNDAGDPFGGEVNVPTAAPVYQRLAGFLGRNP
jgi:uncharacterized protein (TIGR03086 family)